MAPVQIPDVILRTLGRAPCVAPLAVVLHEWDSGIEQLDSAMQYCPRPRPVCPPGCHTSFHFGIGGNCHYHQYVPIVDTAWGFGINPVTCPPSICPPDECDSCTGLTVGQYNQDIDGNPPVLPAFLADACGTANSCVIHVAVTNLFPTNQSLGSGPCCAPNEQAYRCLVQSLCDIFELSGLTPTQSTLLVHCNELVCLDIDQLVIDILACINAPAPPAIPCQCTPTPVQFCAAIDAIPAGAVAVPGVTELIGADCLTHVLPVAPVTDVTVVAVDTPCLDLTVVEAPANTFTISGAPVISPDVGNALSCIGNGLFVTGAAAVPGVFGSFFALMPGDNAATVAPNTPLLFPQDGPAQGGIVRTGPGTFNIPVAGVYEVSWQASVSEAGQLEVFLNGLQVSNTVAGRATGTSQITNDVLITTTVINTILEIRNPAGNAAALTITPIAGGTHAVSAWLIIKTPGGAAGPAGPAGVITVLDTTTVDLTLVGTQLSADVIVSPDVGNNLVSQLNGLFVADEVPAAPVCAAQADLPLVFGNAGGGGAGVWGKPQRPPLHLLGVVAGGSIDPTTGNDVYTLSGVGGTVTLLDPVGCEKTDLWTKNLSADPFDIASAALIDGVTPITLAGTVPAGYPFGNNGGEAVHLVWTGTTWLVI